MTKTVDGVKHTYQYVGVLLRYETRGDVTTIYNAAGTLRAKYTYDSWGNTLSVTDANGNAITSATHIGNLNMIRYRGYYFDSESGFYYLQSRYYDPQVKRFISPDSTSVLTATPASLNDKNLFAYCDNNPVNRVDVGGQFWDTVFDVISLAVSVVDVIQNPDDPWAWAGLAGDAIDLIPFVTGVGEVTRVVSTTKKVVEAADTIHDTAKTIDKATDVADGLCDATKAVNGATENIGDVIVKTGGEVKRPNQIKSTEAINAWDDFLGPNQTSINRFTGKYDSNRIFSADGTRSIRFGPHEMNSIGTTKAHFHYENWVFDRATNTVTVFNELQRIK